MIKVRDFNDQSTLILMVLTRNLKIKLHSDKIRTSVYGGEQETTKVQSSGSSLKNYGGCYH